ncbi:winged helix-turn-helix domain-containing protein [Paraburkholderia ferrariae]|uniref:Transcriptional regulator n=1 Tax=Paraburkholderia ferrariae TaxID=386056 RepID=A0ABU9S0C6_9BURK
MSIEHRLRTFVFASTAGNGPLNLELRFDMRFVVLSRDSDETIVAARTEVSFGSFRLLPAQFPLLEDNKPVPLGSRALQNLVVSLERPGKLVSKKKLMRRVWPSTFVEPATLTVHISAPRRALHDPRNGNRFIINIPGRGYSFVAAVSTVGGDGGDENHAAFRGQLWGAKK